MRQLSTNELDQIEKAVLEQLNASDGGQRMDAMANAVTKLSARVCRLMLQEYQRAASAPEPQQSDP